MLIAASGVASITPMITATNPVAINGQTTSGITEFIDSGNLICFFAHFTEYPAINAAMTAPKNPAYVLDATAPPIKPAPIAGLSAIL